MQRIPNALKMGAILCAMVAFTGAALADPVTTADLAGKKICWSDGGTPTYGENGVYDEKSFGHGTWSLAGDQLTVVAKYGHYTGAITKENGSFHLSAKINGIALDVLGKYCE
jgi:hypothetical protein